MGSEPAVALQPLPPGMKHRFHAMVKPAGSLCNLDCKYCYYLHKEELLQQPRQARMSDEMLERHIRQYIEAQTGEEVVFSWQGGEPTLLGLRAQLLVSRPEEVLRAHPARHAPDPAPRAERSTGHVDRVGLVLKYFR